MMAFTWLAHELSLPCEMFQGVENAGVESKFNTAQPALPASAHLEKSEEKKTCQKDLSPNLDLQFRRKKCSAKNVQQSHPPRR